MRNAISLILSTLCLLALLTSHSVLRAQTPAPSPQSAEATRVDQLITECRQLMAKGSFEGITDKGEEALKLSQKLGDKLRQSRSLMYVALGRFHTGHIDEAIEPFKQSAVLAGEGGDARLQALALRSAAVLMVEAGQYDEALYFYNEALTLQRSLKNRPAEASLLGNVGRIYIAMRDYPRADQVLHESLDMSRELHDQLVEFSALARLSALEINRGDYSLALKYAGDALKLTSSEIDPASKNELRNDVAIAQFGSGHVQQSAETLADVLAFERKGKIASAQGATLAVLSQVQLRLGKTTEAFSSATEALTLLRRSGADPALQANTLYTIAQAQKRLGQSDAALASLKAAIGLSERSRLLSVSTERSRAEFFSSKSDIYLGAIDLLTAAGNHDQALAVAESYHGRAFLDSLAESRADLRKALPRELLMKEDAILRRISQIQQQLFQENVTTEREQHLKKDLAAAEDALEQFQLQVRHSNPQYDNLKHLAPLTVASIQRELLDPKTALIEYVVGDEKSFAWLVTSDKVFFAALPPANELNRLVGDYRKSIAEKSNATKPAALSFNAQSQELYRALVQPFETNLSSRQRLIIVPDGALTYLPFETLMDRRGYLVERFAIGYEPSASALAAIKAAGGQPGARGIVAFGDPAYHDSDLERERSAGANSTAATVKYYAERGVDLRQLPYTRAEVNAIGALFPIADRKVFLGLDANEMRVKNESLERYRYLHFATHGIVDEENPARSGVILSLENNDKEDGILQTTEIMRLKLNADLVTLSACRTGLGKVVAGEGVLGLTRAFMYAGSRSVAASLWNVNDTATAELMKTFYTNLKRGLPKDEALRQAKLGLLHGKQLSWRHPYYWAPFILAGSNN